MVNSFSRNLRLDLRKVGSSLDGMYMCLLLHACAKSIQSCPTLCNTIDCSLPGSSVDGILQARILEWVTISFSGGSSRPRDWTHISYISCTGRWLLLVVIFFCDGPFLKMEMNDVDAQWEAKLGGECACGHSSPWVLSTHGAKGAFLLLDFMRVLITLEWQSGLLYLQTTALPTTVSLFSLQWPFSAGNSLWVLTIQFSKSTQLSFGLK